MLQLSATFVELPR